MSSRGYRPSWPSTRREGISTRRPRGGGQALGYGASAFVFFAIFGVNSPYLQILLRGLGYGHAFVGLVLGLFELTGVLGPLIISRRADRMGRTRPALAFCALAVLASLPPLVMAPRPAVTVLSCALLALGLKTLLPLMDTAAVNLGESLKAEGRGSWDYGKLRAIGSFGFIAMALGLQAIPGFDRSPPSRIALWLAGTTVAYALSLFVLPDPGPRASKQLREGAAARRLDPVFFLGLAIIGLNRLAMAPISSFLSLFVVEDLHWDAVGGLWALSACSEIPLMILSARFIRRLGPMPVIAISGLSIALRLGIYAAFPSHGGVIVGQLLHSLCYGLFQPAAVAFVALRVPPERRAEGMAALIGLGIGLPTFLGSSLGGLMVERFGYRILFASYILFAVASLALYLRARRRFD